MTTVNFETARIAAVEATNKYIAENGENPMGCGFAWVDVRGCRGKKLDSLKAVGFKKKYVGTGVSLWNPSGSYTQDMDAKYAGAVAYAEVLKQMGFDASVGCRLD